MPLVAAAAPPQADRAPDYSKDSTWLCLPGRADVCSTPLATTELNPARLWREGPQADRQGSADRLLLRLSDSLHDPGLNSDLNVQRGEGCTRGGTVRPLRLRLPDFRADLSADDDRCDRCLRGRSRHHCTRRAIAYGDVAAAWRNYLATRNQGRPFVLIGHSQGSLMLQQLISREIENNPAAGRADEAGDHSRLQCARAHGQAGRRDVQEDPLCSREGETGCVISWTSFPREERPAGRRAVRHRGPAGNDGRLRQSGAGRAQPTGLPLDSYWYTRSALPVPGGPIQLVDGGRAADPLRPDPRARVGALRQRGPARISVDPHQS